MRSHYVFDCIDARCLPDRRIGVCQLCGVGSQSLGPAGYCESCLMLAKKAGEGDRLAHAAIVRLAVA